MIARAPQSRSRRDQARAATVAEIRRTARRLLVERGEAGVSLRAIAREVGMTAPALYRYFANLDDLLAAVADDILGDLAGAVVAARDSDPDGDPVARLAAAARGFRLWARHHPREFAAVFARPDPPLAADCTVANSQRLAQGFYDLFVQQWRDRPFPIPTHLDPALLGQLDQLAPWTGDAGGAPLPPGARYVFVTLWVRLYGLVALEIFGHLHHTMADVEPLFEASIEEIAARLRAGERP